MKTTKKMIISKINSIGGVPKMDTSKISRFFKPEEMPSVEPTPLGRHRLVQALRNKYGETYRNKPGVIQAIKDFDDQSGLIKKTIKLGVK